MMNKRNLGRGRGTVAKIEVNPNEIVFPSGIDAGATALTPYKPPPWGNASSSNQVKSDLSTEVISTSRGPEPGESKSPSSGVASNKTENSEQAEKDNGTIHRGVLRGKRIINETKLTRPSSCISKIGGGGEDVPLKANYFRLLKAHDWNVYHYRVDFVPDIEYMKIRKGIIQSNRLRFGGYIFDGCSLFCSKKLNEVLEFDAKNDQGEIIKVTLKLVGTLYPTDYQTLQILNLILRKSMEGFNLQLVGRNLYDALAKIKLEDYKIELWPGYLTSFRQHESDILLCVDITHKVMRVDTIYHTLRKYVEEQRGGLDKFKTEVIGLIVLTDYNNRTYRIDDIAIDSNPRSLFETRDGVISYIDYYKKKYDITIRDPNQPLLISKPTLKKIRGGENEYVMLVPELCRSTGLTESMRSDMNLMRSVSNYSRLNPSVRIERLKAFRKRLYNTKASMEVLNSWNLKLDQCLVECPGRILVPENIYFGDRSVKSNENWITTLRSSAMVTNAILKRWYIVVPTRFVNDIMHFSKLIIETANSMQMQISKPRLVELKDDRNSTYVKTLEECCRSDPQLICVVVPTSDVERYSSIKKKLCVDRAVPSQIICQKTIDSRKKINILKSVATKISIQINCKLMGVPWTVHVPVRGLMTIGFDVCHSTRDRTKTYGAMVATMDVKIATRFFCTMSEHVEGTELSDQIVTNIAKALREFREIHGNLPERILFYRDGVGEGMLNYVYEHEIKRLKESLDNIYATAGDKSGCRLCFIIVTKQINTRYFLHEDNPPPGTIVDDVLTRPERYDFFLVSQSVREGTVSPTAYNILYDNIGFDAGKIQKLTYKSTHLYFNYTAPICVPAVCQYAHKLAYLVGQNLHQCPNPTLEKQLFFL